AKKNNAYSAYSSTANVTPDPASLGATKGATVGTDMFDSAAELLQDEDVRNDRVVQQALAAYNANPSFEIPRAKVNGVLQPASWWASENGTSLSYVNTTTRDIVLVSSGGCISNAAFVPNPNTQYEFTALVRADSGTADFSILAEEYDSDL